MAFVLRKKTRENKIGFAVCGRLINPLYISIHTTFIIIFKRLQIEGAFSVRMGVFNIQNLTKSAIKAELIW